MLNNSTSCTDITVKQRSNIFLNCNKDRLSPDYKIVNNLPFRFKDVLLTCKTSRWNKWRCLRSKNAQVLVYSSEESLDVRSVLPGKALQKREELSLNGWARFILLNPVSYSFFIGNFYLLDATFQRVAGLHLYSSVQQQQSAPPCNSEGWTWCHIAQR